MESTRKSSNSIFKSLSRLVQHFMIFLAVLGMFTTVFPDLANNSVKGRGGIILLFGCICSSFGAVCLRIIPFLYLQDQSLCYFAPLTISRFLVFAELFTLEVLLLWVAFGQSVILFASSATSSSWSRILFGAILACHIVFFELRVRRSSSEGFVCGLSETTPTPPSHENNNDKPLKDTFPGETDNLLPNNSSPTRRLRDDLRETPSLWNRIQSDFGLLRLPFEALILTCVIKLLSHCIPSIARLWPTSKTLLLASKPKWLVPTLSVLVLLLLSVSVCISIRKLRKDDVDGMEEGRQRRKIEVLRR